MDAAGLSTWNSSLDGVDGLCDHDFVPVIGD